MLLEERIAPFFYAHKNWILLFNKFTSRWNILWNCWDQIHRSSIIRPKVVNILSFYQCFKNHLSLLQINMQMASAANKSCFHEIHCITKQHLHADNLLNHAMFTCKTIHVNSDKLIHLLTSISATRRPFQALVWHWTCSIPGSFLALNEAFVIAHLEILPAWWGEEDMEMPMGLFLCAPGGLCFNPFFIAFVNCNIYNSIDKT